MTDLVPDAADLRITTRPPPAVPDDEAPEWHWEMYLSQLAREETLEFYTEETYEEPVIPPVTMASLNPNVSPDAASLALTTRAPPADPSTELTEQELEEEAAEAARLAALEFYESLE